MSSLVVLRSWSDGQPPIVRAIASDHPDDKNDVIVEPDRHGRFVTEEKPKHQQLLLDNGELEILNNAGATLPRNKSSTATTDKERTTTTATTNNNNGNYCNKFGQLNQFRFWQKKDKYSMGSGGSTASNNSSLLSSPSPPHVRTSRTPSRTGSIDSAQQQYYYSNNSNNNNDDGEDEDGEHGSGGAATGAGAGGVLYPPMGKLSLSRESSLPSSSSLAASPIDASPPSSPTQSGGNKADSRYKHLGAELAATIPKRQIIRKSWVRGPGGGGDELPAGYGLLRKKEISKSTPALNSIVGGGGGAAISPKARTTTTLGKSESHIVTTTTSEEDGTGTGAAELSCVVEEEPETSTATTTPDGLLQLKRSISSTALPTNASAAAGAGVGAGGPIPATSGRPGDQAQPGKKRPLSYVDSLFIDSSNLLEPTFGDVPASVVGVIKKGLPGTTEEEKAARKGPPKAVARSLTASLPSPPTATAESTSTTTGTTNKPQLHQRQLQQIIVTKNKTIQKEILTEQTTDNNNKKVNKEVLNHYVAEDEEFTVHSVIHDSSSSSNKSKDKEKGESGPGQIGQLEHDNANDDHDDDDEEEEDHWTSEGEPELNALVDTNSSGAITASGTGAAPPPPPPPPLPTTYTSIIEYSANNKERLIGQRATGGHRHNQGYGVKSPALSVSPVASPSLSPSPSPAAQLTTPSPDPDLNADISSMIMFSSQNSSSSKTTTTPSTTAGALKATAQLQSHLNKLMNRRNNGAALSHHHNWHEEDGDGGGELRENNINSSHDYRHRQRNNGPTAYAQVPVQAVNQHVNLPSPYAQHHHHQQQQQQQQQRQQYMYTKSVQSRKNFCDELLNDNIVLKVPLAPRTPSPAILIHEVSMGSPPAGGGGGGPSAPSMTPPPVPPSVLPPPPLTSSSGGQLQLQFNQRSLRDNSPTPIGTNHNHDGIIFFDEEDEFDQNAAELESGMMTPSEQGEDDEDDAELDDKTSSIVPSEKENSFEYMSVCHNNLKSPNSEHGTTTSGHFPTSSNTKSSMPDINRRVGLDMGSTHARLCIVDCIHNCPSGPVQLQDVSRTITTSDGSSHGYKALSHSMSTKSKLIYKWRPTLPLLSQSCSSLTLFDELYGAGCYNDEEFSQTLEILFKDYAQQLLGNNSGSSSSSNCGDYARGNKSPSPILNGGPSGGGTKSITQYNLSIVSGMDKKLVREAAYNSGLVKPTDELRLINESTAAAAWAYETLKSASHKAASTSHYHHRRRKIGKTFLSINIGSTFIHTSGYEMAKEDGKLHVISPAQSLLYQSLETQFIELLSRIFTPEFILKYESRFTPGWIELLVRFDEMATAYFSSEAKPYLFLPISFYIEFYKCTGMQVPECLEEALEEGIAWDNNGAISFSKQLLNEWLAQPIKSYIKAKLDKSYDNILLSGGIGGGAGDFILNLFEQELPNVNVYKVANPENAVAYGLVSLDNLKISFKSPFSIGVGVMTPFDEKIHPKEKCVTRNEKKWCSDVWDNLIRKGQILTIGEVILKRTYVGAQPGQSVLVLPIFKSYDDEPKLVTSPSVDKCCELRFEIGKEKSWREVQLIIKCYESELAIIASGTDGIISQVPVDF